jgi:hypothetical protein
VLRVDPNSNLLTPRTVLPALVDFHEPGEHWLACAVLAEADAVFWKQAWEMPPGLPNWLNDLAKQP